MKSLAALAAVTVALGTTAGPAFARDSFVSDNAHLFSAATIATINSKVADFSATAHKEVFVDTESTVDGTPQTAAEAIFAKQQVNGVLIYIAKSPKTIGVVPDSASRTFFPPQSTSAIRTAIKSAFNSNDFDGGITNGVDLTLSEYRSHLGALTRQKASYAPVGSGASVRSSQAGFNLSWIWILIVLAVIFFVIRGIFRAMAGPRMMPPGYGGGGPMMGGGGYGPGYGGPGYGGGYGGGGGGGSFWSGLMGGLGGAFLGNELFGGGRRDEFGGNQAGIVDQGQSQADTSGFQSDPGQADMGNASFGGWGGGDSGSGDSGGGGGWGDSGGGGGDFGGGGGDNSGGGW